MFFNMTQIRLFDVVEIELAKCNLLPASEWDEMDVISIKDDEYLEEMALREFDDQRAYFEALKCIDHVKDMRKPDCRTKCQLEGRCDYRHIIPVETKEIALPIVIAAFDIETLCWESVEKQRASKSVPEFDDNIDEKKEAGTALGKEAGLDKKEATAASPPEVKEKERERERDKQDVLEVYPFAKKEKDAVIYIATNFMVYGDKQAFLRIVHCLGEPKFKPEDLPDTLIYTFDENHEAEMLMHWSNMIQSFHCEWLAGYNSILYDLPYCIDRAQVLKIPKVQSNFSRFLEIPHDRARNYKRYRASQCTVRAMGQRFGDKRNVILTPGLIQFDALKTVTQMVSLDTYKLKEVANHYLKGKNLAKKDMPYNLISPFWAAGPDHQRRLAIYCYYDVLITEQTIIEAFFLTHAIEVSRATNSSVTQQMMQGQQIKNWNLIVRKTAERWILDEQLRQQMQQEYGIEVDIVPKYMKEMVQRNDRDIVDWAISQKEGRSMKAREKQFQGATVLDPIIGFYEEPISTLDFSALYPSIMIAHCLCFSTWTPGIRDKKTGILWFPYYDKDVHHRTEGIRYVLWEPHLPRPSEKEVGDRDLIMVCKSSETLICCFVVNRECFFPAILREMLALRNSVKKQQALAEEEGNMMVASILNARQLAIKVICNAAYGFTGAMNGYFPAIAIAITTCFIGRIKIMFVKHTIETLLGGLVIYGDTDSVFIRWLHLMKQTGKTFEEIIFQALYLSWLACEIINADLPDPMMLDFEKMMYPFLMIQKKTYCGEWVWPKPYFFSKGTKNVRRDCALWAKKYIGEGLKSVLKYRRTPQKIYDILDAALTQILDPKIPLHLLQKTVAKKKTYKNDNLAQALLFKKLEERRKIKIDEGTRVPYVFALPAHGTRARKKGEKMADDIEDVDYLIRNNIKVDRAYYVERQLQTTFQDYFGDVIVPKSEISKRCRRAINEIWRQDFGAGTISVSK
jgi:DNA polymerase delta subunit 1